MLSIIVRNYFITMAVTPMKKLFRHHDLFKGLLRFMSQFMNLMARVKKAWIDQSSPTLDTNIKMATQHLRV